MVRIGIAGIGFMGRIHFLGARKLRGAAVTAVCSRDRAKLAGDWTNTRGNFGPAPGPVDLGECKRYERFEEMIADPAIDLIDICTPTHLHPEMAIAALEAGKHVLVEKAIALTTADADAMVAAANKAGRLLMVAHVLPFFPEFRYLDEVIRGGTYGKLLGGHFTRVISRPDWSSDIGDASKTGGPAVDLHIHDTHFIGLIAGVPARVQSSGIVAADGSVEYLTTQYLYDAGPALSCSSGAIAAAGRAFVHGFEVYLEKATLAHNSSGLPLTVYSADSTSSVPDLGGSGDPVDSFTVELQTAVEGVRSGQTPRLLSGELARDALVLCHREIESVKTGQAVRVR
jgi:predicted dehydrogenase